MVLLNPLSPRLLSKYETYSTSVKSDSAYFHQMTITQETLVCAKIPTLKKCLVSLKENHLNFNHAVELGVEILQLLFSNNNNASYILTKEILTIDELLELKKQNPELLQKILIDPAFLIKGYLTKKGFFKIENTKEYERYGRFCIDSTVSEFDFSEIPMYPKDQKKFIQDLWPQFKQEENPWEVVSNILGCMRTHSCISALREGCLTFDEAFQLSKTNFFYPGCFGWSGLLNHYFTAKDVIQLQKEDPLKIGVLITCPAFQAFQKDREGTWELFQKKNSAELMEYFKLKESDHSDAENKYDLTLRPLGKNI
jgi:hypothetical protein